MLKIVKPPKFLVYYCGVSGDVVVETIDLNGKPFHFIGIGGIGMSALAYILAKRQLPVSGSDLRSNHITRRLKSVGAHIFDRQEADNFDFQLEPVCVPAVAVGTQRTSAPAKQKAPEPQIICSTAINVGNAEYRAALERGYPIYHRSDLLAALIKDYFSIAVAGTHGKTTTSSLIGYVLFKAGLDPTIIVGGEVNAWEGNARLGQSHFLVAEADESDGTLAKHAPTIGVVTNIELDHPDHYQSLDEVVATFQIFSSQCATVVGSIDCDIVDQQLKPAISYSLDPQKGADYTVKDIVYGATGTTAEVWERGKRLGTLGLRLLGKHNLSNALAAVAVGRQLGLDFEVIAAAIATFGGAKRRFEVKGERQGITFVDDYAHHPSEIRATLAAARLQSQAQERRLVAIFQPHRYSRTLTFLDQFAIAFGDADLVIVTDIYSAGEINLTHLSGQQVADAIAQHHPRVLYHSELDSLGQRLTGMLRSGDLTLFLGAGNLNQIIPALLAADFASPA